MNIYIYINYEGCTIQQQAATTYLPKSQNYCATADYNVLEEPTWPWKYTV